MFAFRMHCEKETSLRFSIIVVRWSLGSRAAAPPRRSPPPPLPLRLNTLGYPLLVISKNEINAKSETTPFELVKSFVSIVSAHAIAPSAVLAPDSERFAQRWVCEVFIVIFFDGGGGRGSGKELRAHT